MHKHTVGTLPKGNRGIPETGEEVNVDGDPGGVVHACMYKKKGTKKGDLVPGVIPAS